MNFERTIVIGAHNVKVIESDESQLASDTFLGTWQCAKNLITLAKCLPPSRKVEVLIHETIHAILHPANLPEKLDESVVNIIGEGITSFLRSNPELILDMLRTLVDQEKDTPNEHDADKPKSRRKPARKPAAKPARKSAGRRSR